MLEHIEDKESVFFAGNNDYNRRYHRDDAVQCSLKGTGPCGIIIGLSHVSNAPIYLIKLHGSALHSPKRSYSGMSYNEVLTNMIFLVACPLSP